MELRPGLLIDEAALAAVCRRWGVRRLSLFGSVLREDFGPDSDVDVLVEFEQPLAIGVRFFLLADELAPLFGGRRVDLNTPAFLGPRIRDKVVSHARLAWTA